MNTAIGVEERRAVYTAPRLLGGGERLRLLRGIRGMWKHRAPAPIQELRRIRREWERRVP